MTGDSRVTRLGEVYQEATRLSGHNAESNSDKSPTLTRDLYR
jgi:hypothetical protein